MKKQLLVVDDEAIIREIIVDCVGADYEITTASDVPTGMAALAANPPDLLLADLRMPGGGGLRLIHEAVTRFPDLGVVIVTGHGAVDDFVSAVRMGVADYVLKPFTPTTLRRALQRALETRQLRAENARLRVAVQTAGQDEMLLGQGPVITEVRDAIARVAPTDTAVLITGASGTGKELAAKMIHAGSSRARGPFVAVHAGALPEDLIESELFGHVRGAFTSAGRDRRGRIEEADEGTLFLDEVATMSPAAQVRLLRVLAAGEVTRVGSDSPRRVNVRVVAATNIDLRELVRAGQFRADLLYRLDVFPIAMPLLRDRPEDIPLLASELLRRACLRQRRSPVILSQEAIRMLMAHPWPGNVRELENVMERAAIVAPAGTSVAPEHLLLASPRRRAGHEVHVPEEGLDLAAFLAEVEADLIQQALALAKGNRSAAAALLGLHRSTLGEKLRLSPPPPHAVP